MEAEGGRALRRLRTEVLRLSVAQVHALDGAGLRLGVDDLRIRGVEHAVEAVAAPERDPVRVHDPVLRARAARAHPVLVVLQAAADAVGSLRVHVDAIELAGRHPAEMLPALARLVALVRSAVRAEQEPLGVSRIDGQGVVVRVHLLEEVLAERAAAVVGDVKGEPQDARACRWRSTRIWLK
jgi:ABC-type transporter Mla MlaB component